MKNKLISAPATFFFIILIVIIIGFFRNYNREYFGEECKGIVISLKGNGSRQVIDYKYIVNEKTFYGHGTITYSPCREDECIGNECIVMYDKENPTNSRVTDIITK